MFRKSKVMLFEIVLFLALATIVILALFAPGTVSYKESYSYLQHYEPEDEKRVEAANVNAGVVSTEGAGCGCGGSKVPPVSSKNPISSTGCDSLSRFEIPHYMGDSQCKLGPSKQYDNDPGYFLGNTVI